MSCPGGGRWVKRRWALSTPASRFERVFRACVQARDLGQRAHLGATSRTWV